MAQYKCGDVVRIREDLELGRYNDVYAVSEMCIYKGKVAKIINFDDFDNTYQIDIDGGDYYWTDSMFSELLERPKATPVGEVSNPLEVDINKPHYTVNYTIPNCDTIFSMDVNLAEYNAPQHYYLFTNADGKPFYLFESNVDSIVRIS